MIYSEGYPLGQQIQLIISNCILSNFICHCNCNDNILTWRLLSWASTDKWRHNMSQSVMFNTSHINAFKTYTHDIMIIQRKQWIWVGRCDTITCNISENELYVSVFMCMNNVKQISGKHSRLDLWIFAVNTWMLWWCLNKVQRKQHNSLKTLFGQRFIHLCTDLSIHLWKILGTQIIFITVGMLKKKLFGFHCSLIQNPII